MIFKSLELNGFKSFADKTRFEFSDGVTIVVGPNGSGKSNVVDAIKWVLGEQRVKSLRGKEMTDVIFAGATGRKPLNAAEVTLTFDNSANQFHIDAPELQITRRVMRSGESEYLINRQTSRLKDIKELLTGTGIGTQAYCIIEQGKVDALLQSSPQDRRAIFEEAAGISRSNIRTQEAQKRLEHAVGNLQRLSDIIGENEGRLRSLKIQAGKANKYREYTQRLQALRTEAGIVDWKNLTAKIDSHDANVAILKSQSENLQSQMAAIEKQIAEIESNLSGLDSQMASLENDYSDTRELIATDESNAANQLRRLDDITQQQNRYRNQSARLVFRTAEQQIRRRNVEQEYHQAQSQREVLARQLADCQAKLTQLQKQADQIELQNEQCRKESLDKTRTVAALTNEISSLERQLEAKDEHRRNDQQRLEDINAELSQSGQLRDQAIAQSTALNDEKETCEEKVQELRLQLDDIVEQLQRRQQVLEKLRMRRTGLMERVGLLEELQNKREELNPGLKQVLQKAKDEPKGPFGAIVGLAGDLFQVGVEAAGLIELALGPAAEYLVVGKGGEELIQALKAGNINLTGRVGFIWLDGFFASSASDVNLEGRTGVVGRADQFVQADKKYMPLVRRLLAHTWIVESLSDAFSLSATVLEPLNYITLTGDRLAADGSLTSGVKQSGGGSIARRSEWNAKKDELAELEKKIFTHLEEAKQLEQAAGKREQTLRIAENQLRKARTKSSDAVNQLTALEERFLQVQRRKEEIVHSMTKAEEDRKETQLALSKVIEDKKASQVILTQLETTAQQLRSDSEQNDLLKRQASRETTQKQVQLAQCEERCEGLKTAIAQDDQAMDERIQDIDQCAIHLKEQSQAELSVSMAFLKNQSDLALLYLQKESLQEQLAQVRLGRDSIAAARHEHSTNHSKISKEAQKIDKQYHEAEMVKIDWEHQRSDLSARLKEDYDIDIAALSAQAQISNQDGEAAPDISLEVSPEVQKEIKLLRNKIAALGSVNMEAMTEMDALEKRFAEMSARYSDLTESKQELEKLIERLKVDSRRKFQETVESVRSRFNNLFGDLFGGGRAEIVIDENEDVLEAGVEIIAQPPGKELSHISLLSGGEKTLTCVALLLAMFEANPSPFCVLDEVDAALDEANTDRFSKVLKRFQNITQFICISHSKRTMSVADTIYGITMQESGVSRQLSVRFEDVTDDGNIVISDKTGAA